MIPTDWLRTLFFILFLRYYIPIIHILFTTAFVLGWLNKLLMGKSDAYEYFFVQVVA